MKKALITLGLLALATTALAGCAHPHNDDRHRHHSDAGHTTMMAPGSGMGMMGHQQHVDHGGMHGSGPMHHDGMDHGDGHHGNGRHDPFAASHERMMEDMHGFELTGDPDYDFVRGMIPHHEAAIDMARILLQYSDDPELRSLAEDVIREQEREIREMQDWLNR